MPALHTLLAPLALLIHLSSSDAPSQGVALGADTVRPVGVVGQGSATRPLRNLVVAGYEVPVVRQVHIEQRVVVRIAPRDPADRQELMIEAPRPLSQPRFEERKMEKCVPVRNIAGVQTGSGNQLMLYLRDRRIVIARLEKACLAREFYSGFYLEKNKDGMLCVDRDKLQSRAGANCELKRMRELVPTRR